LPLDPHGPAAGHWGGHDVAGGSLSVAMAAIGVHTVATLVVTGVVAMLVYEWIGLAFLRRGWINLDLLWTAALIVTGLLLLLAAGR